MFKKQKNMHAHNNTQKNFIKNWFYIFKNKCEEYELQPRAMCTGGITNLLKSQFRLFPKGAGSVPEMTSKVFYFIYLPLA